MKRTIRCLVGLLSLLLLIGGCQRQTDPVGPQIQPQSAPGALGKISLPPGTTIKSAKLYVYQRYACDGQTVNVHRITAPWEEGTTTWNNFGNQYDPGVVASYPTGPAGWDSVEIKSIVQQWVDGVYPDYGILLEQSGTSFTNYWSSEASLNRPRLVLVYQNGGSEKTVTIERGTTGDIADTHVWAEPPYDTVNYGSVSILYTGHVDGYAVYELMKFDVTVSPGTQGCTRGQGYWKTHSKYSRGHYNATWAKLTPSGEDSPFFLSGKSYYQVLRSNPRGGNAYYILAHAYIAARLNMLNGASIPNPVQHAYDQATQLFNTYTPAQVGAWKGWRGQRFLFIRLAGTLEFYNNGHAGPRRCPGERWTDSDR